MWRAARDFAFAPEQAGSPLAGRPYDLRHAAVSLWLNAGVPAPTVARRAGHSVDVLLRFYATCIDGDDEIANQRISEALCLCRPAETCRSPSRVYPAITGRRPHLVAHGCI